MSADVHWHEGLFLQPHHLQAQQRQLSDRFATERRLGLHYPYGLVASKLSADALENSVVQFEQLTAVMPSGVLVDFPSNATLPALDIRQSLAASSQPVTVLLGVPLYYESRANAIEGNGSDTTQVKRIFSIVERDLADENTGDNPVPVKLRRVNARLLLDTDDRADLETMPLLRVAQGTGEQIGLPRQDPNFIPPCLVTIGSPTLGTMLRDLANQIEASRDELVVQLTRGGFSLENLRGLLFEQVMRLRTLNRFAGRLPTLVRTPNVTPLQMYLELRELLGELAALHPDSDDFAVSPYNHDKPAVAFQELDRKIRPLLRGAVAPSAMKVEFAEDQGAMVARLGDEHLSKPSDYFLAVRGSMDARQLASLVENADQFKLMPLSLVHRNVWGVKLQEERQPPLELPVSGDLHYFRLLRSESERMWQRIVDEKVMAARWPDMDQTSLKLTLYMLGGG